MTNKHIRKKVNKLLKNTGGKTDFVSIENYLKTLGFSIVFFNTPTGDKEIERYNLDIVGKKVPAFTFYSTGKIIFIDNNVSSEDKNYLLYHEVGHILLGHLDYERISTKNKYLSEFEADTFAQYIVNPPKINFHFVTLLLLISIFIFAFYLGRFSMPKEITVSNPSVQDTAVIDEANNSEEELVAITRTGNKYHTPDCRYINSTYILMPITQAEKLYSPCSICR